MLAQTLRRHDRRIRALAGPIRRGAAGAAALLALIVAAPPASAHSGHPGPIPIELRGNALSGGFSLAPTGVPGMAIGESLRFINRDGFGAHRIAHDAGVWDTGELKPGEEKLRPFEAGAHPFHCVLHPEMRGEVDLPVSLYTDRHVEKKKKRKRGAKRPPVRYDVIAIWAFGPPEAGAVFDVERRIKGAADWTRIRTGTETTGSEWVAAKRRIAYEVRARVRRGEQASGWSPVAEIASP